jgi:hypothetical protein
MRIDKNNFVTPDQLKAYEEIDGLKVIEELLLYKGVEVAGANKTVSAKLLDEMALVTYSLKVTATNKLYVGLNLDKFYKRAGLTCDSGKIKVPAEIYDRVKALNDI